MMTLEETIAELTSARIETALAPDMTDLMTLHYFVRKWKPNIVIEFGSGYSTAAIAHALALNDWGQVFTVESEHVWHQDMEISFSSKRLEFLNDHTTFFYSTLVRTELGGQRVVHYDNYPKVTPDLIYLDGPELRYPNEVITTPEIYIRRPLREQINLLVDHREATVDWLENRYSIQSDNVYGVTGNYPSPRPKNGKQTISWFQF